jgi:hypothetical protein
LRTKYILKQKQKNTETKTLKSCKRNAHALCDSIKRPNLHIMGIEEGKEVQVKEVDNIFKKIIA